MVYCDKCGAKNEDDAVFCSKCGAELKEGSHRHHDRDNGYYRQREECFGLPHGSVIAGVIFGGLLILFGLSSIFGWNIWDYVGPIVIVIIGLLIMVGAIYRHQTR
jgi:uncharacterized membrane protein YvbJ